MKTIGLIGGMSWESSLEYYRIINKIVKERLGEPHSCKSIMYSVDFAEIDKLQHQGEWEVLTNKMVEIAQKLEKVGADLVLICTNTMHKMAKDVQENIKIPLLHIADATADEIKAKQMNRVGLLGTKFTMEQDFYKKRLKEKYGIDVIIPAEEEREIIHNVIFKELVSGFIKNESRDKFKEIITNLKNNGAEGVILGCTEIPLLIKEEDSIIPIFNTMMLHAKKAVEFALA
ncbi:aspartate racemase [Orenia metallireducens]|uniref:Aspartate racemase n=1 Tax=Orenia metallireducens TaxID=1413210 RepID=A0A1C0A8T3_9FIRM|nr:aspartate/glutamate racemase family protein [Orenia metallireducens]OCL26673.1 aspartate racemase [Orenia metallireducens]